MEKKHEDVGLMPVFTLVLWVFCLAVGVVGLLYGGLHPSTAATQSAALPLKELTVEVTEEAEPASDDTSAAADEAPVSDAAPLPLAPAVALASPEVAFALPVEGPSRIVAAAIAVPTKVKPAAVYSAEPAKVKRLTFGEGEGRQPEPEYPMEAQLAGQEGTVVVRLTVGADGRVISAETAVPSRWPLLNQAALRTVRKQWRFEPGAVRSYEISIQFQMKQN